MPARGRVGVAPRPRELLEADADRAQRRGLPGSPIENLRQIPKASSIWSSRCTVHSERWP